VDQRLRTAIDSSLHWYGDIFSLHDILTTVEAGLWWAQGPPPRWHSAAKTIEPTTSKERALRAVEPFDHCSIADSFGVLDLSDVGFEILLGATWLHHPPLARTTGVMPRGWSVIQDQHELEAWNAEHDTADVLLPLLLTHQRFNFLARQVDGSLVAGAVLHDWGGAAVGMSNAWAVAGTALDPEAILQCASILHPDRALVDFAHGTDLDTLIDAGFDQLGPQIVWAR